MSKAVKVKEWFFSLERTSLAANLRPGSQISFSKSVTYP